MTKKIISSVLGVVKRRGLTFLAGFVFALLCFIVINAAMKPVSKSEYCGTKCHEMDSAYQSWKPSVHGANKRGLRAECVDCHLPSKDKYFTHIVVKAYEGGKDMYKHYFGGEYDVEKIREKVLGHMPNKRCLNCHKDLLVKPGSEAAKEAHTESLSSTDASENRCVDCHEGIGHER